MAKNKKARAALKKPRPKKPYRPDFAPSGIAGPKHVFGGTFDVGGGRDEAEFRLAEQQQAMAADLSRQQMGMGLMQNIQETMRDPFSIVSALQMYGKAGGGTMAPAVALSQSGGRGAPSPYGEIADRLMRGLSEFSGATPINPQTGVPFTPMEMDNLRKLSGQDLMAGGATPQQTAIELARSEPNRQSINPDAYNLPENMQGSQWPTAQPSPVLAALRARTEMRPALAGAGAYMKSSPLRPLGGQGGIGTAGMQETWRNQRKKTPTTTKIVKKTVKARTTVKAS